MKLLAKIACVFTLVAINLSAYAANEEMEGLQDRLSSEWQVQKNDQRHGLKTYARQEKGKRYRSFKVEAVMDGHVEDAIKLLLDFDNYKRWSWEVIDSKLLKQVSPTEYYFYVTHNAPYGVPDRDVVLRMVIEPQSQSQSAVVVKLTAVPSYLPPHPPYVRMLAEDMTNVFKPLPDNKVFVQSEGYIDPGGNMQPWAINFTQRNAPYATLLGIRRMLALGRDQFSKVALPFPVYEYDKLP